ncbi:MAG: sulfatase-like hydrolase/transferase [Planctomycetaceae bacterium]|nr:sulfatase-like hydrolase/transferase [Planctomycetaceae bacterium]
MNIHKLAVIQLSLLALLLCSLLSESLRADDSKPPNIVVFLADDLGWGDLACYGNDVIKTPHLDQFATEGVRFTQCYSACGVCSPSRSSILTGRTPFRNGVYRWVPEAPKEGSHVYLRTSEITIPELLKERGYETCHVGKWHLNGDFNSPTQPQPDAHGYDYWFATQNNAAPTHKNPVNFVRNGEEVGPLEGFSAPLVVKEAIHWLQNEHASDRPFFLTVWTHEPHLPIESDPQYMQLYADLPIGFQQHHGNVTQMDAAFGRLMAAFEKMQLTDETIVLFTADNGPEGDGLGDPKNPGSQRDRTRGSTGGLRGRKRADFEGGIRVPGIVRWPGHIKSGTVSNVPVIGSDIFTTVCDIVNIPLPQDRVIDGASMLPAFNGESIERPVPLYWRTHISPKDCRVAIRIDDWKIVADETLTKFLLFNLQNDPEETTDVSTAHPEIFNRMQQTLLDLDQQVLSEGPDWWKQDSTSGVAHLK